MEDSGVGTGGELRGNKDNSEHKRKRQRHERKILKPLELLSTETKKRQFINEMGKGGYNKETFGN